VLAVLTRHAGISLGSADVFVSLAGGVRIDEPGADLAVALAVASAAKGVAAGAGAQPLAAFGELGLTGELRHAAHPDRRLAEAKKFGLKTVLCPGKPLPDLRSALRAGLGEGAPAARAA
jgi:DNA repair protein RadA/Sms